MGGKKQHRKHGSGGVTFLRADEAARRLANALGLTIAECQNLLVLGDGDNVPAPEAVAFSEPRTWCADVIAGWLRRYGGKIQSATAVRKAS